MEANEAQKGLFSINEENLSFDDEAWNKAFSQDEVFDALKFTKTGMDKLKDAHNKSKAEYKSALEKVHEAFEKKFSDMKEKVDKAAELEKKVLEFEKKASQNIGMSERNLEFEREIEKQKLNFFNWAFSQQFAARKYGENTVPENFKIDVSFRNDVFKREDGLIKLADPIDSILKTNVDFAQWAPMAPLSGRVIEEIKKVSPVLTETDVITSPVDYVYLVDNIPDQTFDKMRVRTLDDHKTSIGDFTRRTITLHYLNTYISFDWKFLETIAASTFPFDFEAFLEGRLRKSYTRELERLLTFGTGDADNEPFGCLYRATGVGKDIKSVKTGVADNLFADFIAGFKNVVKELPAQVLPNAKWFMNLKTWLEVTTYTDSSNRPYIDIGTILPTFLWGRPVTLFDTMPDVGAGARPIMFGNLRESFVTLLSPREYVQMDDSFEKKIKQMRWVFQFGGAPVRSDMLVDVECAV